MRLEDEDDHEIVGVLAAKALRALGEHAKEHVMAIANGWKMQSLSEGVTFY